MTDETPAIQPLTQAGSAGLTPVQASTADGLDTSASASAGADRPEIIVGAAFAAGFALAMVLKRLARQE